MLGQEKMTSSLSNYRCLALALVFSGFGALPCFAQLKIYIQPDNGFETYISAALTKKNVPVVVVSEEDAAAFILQPTPVDVKTESTGSKVARCLFLYCVGIQGEQTVSIQLFNPRTRASVWAYTVRKYDAHAYQSSAEAIAKHLKQFLEEHKELLSVTAVPVSVSEKARRQFVPVGTTATVVKGTSEGPAAQKTAERPFAENGTLVAKSIPDGAELYADDDFVGNCPATLKLKPGKHYIRVFLKDHQNWSREITVVSGSEVNLTATLVNSN